MKKSTAWKVWIGKAETCPDIRYRTGFRAVDSAVLMVRGRRRILVVDAMEVERARRAQSGNEVYAPDSLGLSRRRRRQGYAAWIRGVAARCGGRCLIVPADFPLGVARRLERAGFRVRVARTALTPEREVKRGEEMAAIAQAQRAAVAAMRSAVALIAKAWPDRRGILRTDGGVLTSERVKRRIGEVLLDRDCSAEDTIVAGGEHGVDPHRTGSGPLRAGEAIVIDIFPKHRDHGYWGDLTRTVVRGRAPEALRRQYAAVRGAQRAALKTVRAGARAAAVHAAAVDSFAKKGYETRVENGRHVGFIHGTGHGVGLEIHEAPRLSLAGGRLKAGHVITVEPGLYYPGVGGVRIEDTVAVTARGFRLLAPCPYWFELRGRRRGHGRGTAQ